MLGVGVSECFGLEKLRGRTSYVDVGVVGSGVVVYYAAEAVGAQGVFEFPKCVAEEVGAWQGKKGC